MQMQVSRDTYSHQVADSLRQFVMAENLRPGDMLPSTAELADRYGVSRPVIREALKSLEGRGLIQLIKGKGAVVCAVDRSQLDSYFERIEYLHEDAIRELLEVRRALETHAAGEAARRATPEDIVALGELVEQMRSSLSDLERYADLDVNFHMRVVGMTGNAVLGMLVGSIRESLRRSILTGLQQRASTEELEEVQRFHEDALSAIRNGDPAEARRAMDAHFDAAVRAVAAVENRSGS